MTESNLLALYLAIAIGGILLEVGVRTLYFKLTKNHFKTHHYSVGKYLFYLLFPLLATAMLVYLEEWTALSVFFTFALVGTFLEYLIGWTYDKIVGQRLWTYHRLTIQKYTSFLSVPIWGFGGVMFYLIAKLFV